MKLAPIPKALVVKRNPHLWPGIPGCPNTEQEVGSCVNVKHVANSNRTQECGARVWAGNGYADLDGAPFKAYYCVECAARLLLRSEQTA